jgi:hypothetical protein
VQPAVAPIGDGKHSKNENEGANELEWGIGDGLVRLRSVRDGLEAGSYFIEEAIG